jgi:hypothetical protein
MAYALLAKLYLNAEVYTGEDRYNDVVSMCDAIISEVTTNGTFALDADYLSMFYLTNGPSVKDFIYAVPYNNVYIGNNYPCRYWLHKLLKTKYGLPFTPSGCMRTWPEYYAKFTIDATDVRQNQWLAGKQYNTDGTAITIKTTKQGYDSRYKGADAKKDTTIQLEFTPNIEFRDVTSFETGNDYAGLEVGYRNNKFYPDATSTSRNQSNDVPVFRYADVLLMKAEAILRGASTTFGQTPLELVNKVRHRAKASLFITIDLAGLLDERVRELSFECWRRNDLIRYGKWEEKWGVKTDNDVNRRLFPVPTTVMDLNPSFVQNPGY